ncbi:MAG TPA: hypothetical protein PK280_08620 [Planctomycetota bacterium]|nr:hypothetical protein [Planctomycetota bacterium]
MQVQCPSCSAVVTFPDERAGQVVNCASCGGQMQLPALAPSAAAPSSSPLAGPQAPSGPTKACPYCGEQILVAAQKCRHCSSILTGPNAGRGGAPGASRPSSSDGTTALVLGIIGLVLFCIPLLPVIMGILAIKYGRSAQKEQSQQGTGTAGLVLGIIALGLGIIFGGLQCIGFLAGVAEG